MSRKMPLTVGQPVVAPTPAEGTHAGGRRAAMIGLTLGALGVVFGDIGTSPLYAIREVFAGSHPLGATPDRVYGVVSMVFWSLVIIVTLKYVTFILRADNQGEGGIMALIALLQGSALRTRKAKVALVALGILGASLFYGDSMITPAVSVLSAVEGLKIFSSSLDPWVVPITLAVLTGLFAIQRHGTGLVGRLFGPVMIVWFAVLAATGAAEVSRHPGILRALSPSYAAEFIFREPARAFLALGSVVLVVTGVEALYADMGHFGRGAIRRAWFLVVFPALLLQYMGQGALLLSSPGDVDNPFYRLAPDAAQIPMVFLATLATVIASQAVISGAYSVTRQAMRLGYLPRVHVRHTSSAAMGQIYVPTVSLVLFIAVVGLVLGFRSSSHLASAYGIAVTGTLAVDTILAFVVFRLLWRRPLWLVVVGAAGFLIVDLAFFSANVPKILHGGWFPLAIGLVVFTTLTTWRRGRALLTERLRSRMIPLDALADRLRADPPVRVPGCAVFLTAVGEGAPRALLHNLEHNHVLHQKVIFFTAQTENVPHVPDDDCLVIEHLGHGLRRVIARYGFMDVQDVPATLRLAAAQGLDIDPDTTSYFLNRVTFLATPRPGMARWRERLFAAMSRNSKTAAEFFHLPSDQIVELGMQIEL